MFGPRTETARERVLLRMIEQLQRQNMELVNQVLYLSGRTWTPPPIFTALQEAGGIHPEEMWRTFNMGVGMVVVVPAGQADHATEVDGLRVRVRGLEALDGTPIVDVKPVLGPVDER